MRAWNYWWGYTRAQIELMAADQPVVDYHWDETQKRRRNRRAGEEWKKKYGGGKRTIDIKDIWK